MASPSDNRCVMGYPSTKPNQHVPPPVYGMPIMPPYQAGAYPHPPPPTQPEHNGYVGPIDPKTYPAPSSNVWNGSRPGNQGPSPTGWAPPDEERGKKFGRVMLITMVTLILCMCVLILLIWFLYGMEIPEFRLSTLSVSNLNVSESLIAASWDANVTVYNPNSDVKVKFDPIKASIFYKNYPLGMSSPEPVYLQGTRIHNLAINLDNQTAVPGQPLPEEITADQKKGVLYVSLRMSLGANFVTSSIGRKETLRVFCEDLKVNLSPQGGTSGTLAENAKAECLTFT